MLKRKMICCLCINASDQCVPIFETAAGAVQASPAEIITKYFQMNLLLDDFVSNYICTSCWRQLQDFHEFYLKISQKQEELRILNSKEEREVPKLENVDEKANDFLFCEPEIDGTEINAFVDGQEFGASDISSTHSKDCVDADISSTQSKDCVDADISSRQSTDCVDDVKYNTKLKRIKPKKQCRVKSKPNVLKEDVHNNGRRRLRSGKIESENADSSCSTRAQRSSALDIRKENDAYIAQNAELNCFLCLQPLKDFADLKTHFKNKHECVGYVLCCAKRFLQRGVFVDHLMLHKNPNLFKCNECDKKLTSRNCYNNHMVTCHPPEQELKFECKICKQKFAKQYVLGVHMRKHCDKKAYNCESCEKSYRSLSDLRGHQRTVHLNVYAIICDICGKNFRNKQSFKNHRIFVHPDDDIIEMQCKVCQRWLKNKRILQMHMKNHRDVKAGRQLVCNICGVVKQTRQTLFSHKRYHHSGQIFKCTLCAKEFKRALSLEEHMATHTGKALYQCNFCPQTFKSHANMHTHKKRLHPNLWVRKHTQPKAKLLIDIEMEGN